MAFVDIIDEGISMAAYLRSPLPEYIPYKEKETVCSPLSNQVAMQEFKRGKTRSSNPSSSQKKNSIERELCVRACNVLDRGRYVQICDYTVMKSTRSWRHG